VDLFQKIVAGAVIDAGVDCVMRGRLGPGADHPMLMTHPEGEYLKACCCSASSEAKVAALVGFVIEAAAVRRPQPIRWSMWLRKTGSRSATATGSCKFPACSERLR